jgi:hypothetical protein
MRTGGVTLRSVVSLDLRRTDLPPSIGTASRENLGERQVLPG